MDLNEIRKQIDEIDEELMSLFSKRVQFVLKIAKWKKKEGLPVFDEKREEAVLEKIGLLAKKNKLDPCIMEQIFVIFMAYCRSIEKKSS